MVSGSRTVLDKDGTVKGYIDFASCPNSICSKAYESVITGRTPFDLVEEGRAI
jgi:hypothetical protein